MKCQNCGKEESNFHYTSNINGNITETHLCADCAGKLGYSEKAPTRPEMSFEEIFGELFGGRPNRRMLSGYGMMFPTFVIPTIGMIVPTGEIETDTDEPEQDEVSGEQRPSIAAEIDEDMKKRREINVMREQMKKAAAAEDYEKAAALRDSIRTIESSERL